MPKPGVKSPEPTAVGIAFEGCGCRAAFHVGAIEWFMAHQFSFVAIGGASSGALVAGAAALGQVADLRSAWSELFGTRVCDLRRLLIGQWPFRMSEIVESIATRHFGDRLLADTLVPLAVVVTQWQSWGFERRVLTAQDRIPLARAIQASCFIPGPYSRMIPIDRRLTFDGAWLGRVPIREVHQLGARKVIACVSDTFGRLLRGALWATQAPDPTDLDYRVLSPVTPLPIGSFDFHHEETLESFEIGRASAKAFADRHREWLSAPATGS